MSEIRLEDFVSDFHHKKELVHQWDFVDVKGYDVRIFFQLKNKKKGGFYFYVLDQVAVSGHKITKKNPWHPAHCSVECLCYGEAAHDGIYDFWLGNNQTKNKGKQRYIDLDQHQSVFETLRKLEKKNCFTDQ